MGTWDVMSTHYVEVKGPPPGISSFTKIRLGWISPEQVLLVSPGETRGAFLSPLGRGGDNLVIKIPLPNGKYYLVENRQKIGFDQVQPDSGILVLKVDPEAQEGSGTARIMDADQGSANFSHATFRLDRENRQIFVDKENRLAVIPLWSQGENQGVLVTPAEKGEDALKAAQTIVELWRRFPQPGEKQKPIIEGCLESFKRFDFTRSYQIGKQLL
ncbi:MAG: hypothetical protein V1689_03275 [Pseudomonadota bacterium]